MPIIEMDPEIAWRAIEGYENVLTPEANSLRERYAQFRCNRCGGKYQEEIDPRHVFRDGTLVPRSLLRCASCNHLLDPFTGLTVEVGSVVEEPTPHGGLRLPHRG